MFRLRSSRLEIPYVLLRLSGPGRLKNELPSEVLGLDPLQFIKGNHKRWRSVSSNCISIICFIAFLLMLNVELLQNVIFSTNSFGFTTVKKSRDEFEEIPTKLPVIDFSRENKTLWPEDPLCSKFLIYFSKDIEPTYLVSFPRSGNTWTRYLIEASTGIFSGSVYDDKRIKHMGFVGELEPHTKRSTIVIKTHTNAFKDTPLVPLHGRHKVILIIRNPAEGVPSYYSFSKMREREKAHTQTIDEKKYNSKDFRKFVREMVPKWREIVEYILLWTKNLLVVFYEDLVDDPLSQVRRIMEFLKVPEDPERIACLANHIHGPAKRKHQKIDPLITSEKKYIAHAVANAMGLLKLRGIKIPQAYGDWILPLNTQINTEPSS